MLASTHSLTLQSMAAASVGNCSRKYLLDRQGEVPRGALALPDQEGPIMPLFAKHFFCLGSGDFAKKPPRKGKQAGQHQLLHKAMSCPASHANKSALLCRRRLLFACRSPAQGSLGLLWSSAFLRDALSRSFTHSGHRPFFRLPGNHSDHAT